MKHKTITAVSKYNYCSHKFHCYLGGQHRLATPPLMLRFYHSDPPRVYVVQFKFQANRLRQLPAAPSNPLTGFQNSHACGMHLHSRRSRLYTRIVSKSSVVLSTDSSHYKALLDGLIIQNSSLKQHSTSWDAGCPTFLQNFCAPLGHGCTA